VDDVDFGAVLGQEVGLLHRTVTPTNHGDGLVAKQGSGPVTHCTSTDALVPVRRCGILVFVHVCVCARARAAQRAKGPRIGCIGVNN